jgi:hypothetical protein
MRLCGQLLPFGPHFEPAGLTLVLRLLRLLPLLGRTMRLVRHALPFGREFQPGLPVLVAQRARGLLAAFLRLLAVMIGFTLRHARDCG